MKNPFKKPKHQSYKRNEFFVRLVSKKANINYKKIILGHLNEVDWARLTRAAGQIHEKLESLNEP